MKCIFVVFAVVVIAIATNNNHLFGHLIEANQKEGGNTWVVLIAGSHGWGSYRYQSSVCKVYQLVHKAGVPDDHIITLFADDIAYNSMNPFPGQIYNELYDANGTNINVYEGVVKDYTGENATKQNLIDVLSGNSITSGSGKTLLSTEDDNVFIFYDGSGAAGFISMPDDNKFHDSDLTTVLSTMTSKRMFKNLVIFLSSAYSGSMIENQILPPNVYVVTSASSSGSSYACLQDPELHTFVTSCFSHGWIHSIDIHGPNVDFGTIYEEAYNYATSAGPTTPCEYGDLSIKSTTWSAFLKNNESVASSSISSSTSSIVSSISLSISSGNDNPADMSSQINGAHSLSHTTCSSDIVTSLLLFFSLFCYSYSI